MDWQSMETAPRDGSWVLLRLSRWAAAARWTGRHWDGQDDSTVILHDEQNCFGWSPMPKFENWKWAAPRSRYRNSDVVPASGQVVTCGVGAYMVASVEGEDVFLHKIGRQPIVDCELMTP